MTTILPPRSRRRLRLLLGLVAFVVGVAVSLGAAFASTAAETATAPRMLLRDNFATGARGNWSFFNREGQITLGRLWIDGGYMSNSYERNGWALTHIGDTTWTDYAFEATYNTANVNGSPSYTHSAIFFVRVKAENGNQPMDMYDIIVWDPGQPYEGLGTCTDASNGYVILQKFVDGSQSNLAESCASNTIQGTNTVRIEVRGGEITVFANGSEVLSYTDAAPITYGGVGVGQIWETNGWFDDVIVRTIR